MTEEFGNASLPCTGTNTGRKEKEPNFHQSFPLHCNSYELFSVNCLQFNDVISGSAYYYWLILIHCLISFNSINAMRHSVVYMQCGMN